MMVVVMMVVVMMLMMMLNGEWWVYKQMCAYEIKNEQDTFDTVEWGGEVETI